MKRPGFAVFSAPRVSHPAGMCSFSRHGEGDRDSYCCRTKLHARWMGLQAPAIVKGLNKSRPVETQRCELPSPQAFQASDRDAHKHSWPPSRRRTRSVLERKCCNNPAHPALICIQDEEQQQTRGGGGAGGGCNCIGLQKLHGKKKVSLHIDHCWKHIQSFKIGGRKIEAGRWAKDQHKGSNRDLVRLLCQSHWESFTTDWRSENSQQGADNRGSECVEGYQRNSLRVTGSSPFDSTQKR